MLKLSMIGAVAAIIVIPLFAQMGGAINPSVHAVNPSAIVRGAVEPLVRI